MSVIRLSLTLLTGLVAALAALGLSAEVANSGEEVAPETITATLEPGDNFIGWVSEPIGVEDVFAAIPDAALIYTWDADRRVWRFAIRGVGGSLTALEPGMAAMIRIVGDKPVEWDRQLTPARGSVTLYRGVNWVTWVGRDNWPLDRVARGIGQSVVSIRVGDVTYPAPLDTGVDELPVLSRGDALEVTVSRDLRWLQPTGMLPNIVWVGDISQTIREEIAADIRRVVDFLSEEFAVETDFADTTVLIWEGIDAAVEYEASGAGPSMGANSPAWLRNWLTSGRLGGAQPWGFYMPACSWQSPRSPDCHGYAPHTLVHEWFHFFQYQLSAGEDWHVSPIWMIEGAATWAEWQSPSRLLLKESSEDARQRRLDEVIRTTAPLQSAEDGYRRWEYSLGSIAVERLVDRSGVDALLEYSRQLHPQIIEPERYWLVVPYWQDAFQVAFGLTVGAFYEAFALWRETLPAPIQHSRHGADDKLLSGTLHFRDGSPAAGFIVNAEPYDGELTAGIARATIVDERGNFSLDLTPNTSQRIWIKQASCDLWLIDEGLATERPQPGEFRDLDTRNLPKLHLTLPEGACENELRARAFELRGDPRSVQVLLIDAETYDWTPMRLGPSGTYAAYAPEPGDYRVRVRLDNCELYYSKRGLVASRRDGDVLELSDKPERIEFRIPRDLCVRQISGRTLDEHGNPVGGGWLQMAHGDVSSSGEVPRDGRFSFTVPDSGDYVLSIGTDTAGCRLIYATSGATTDWRQAALVIVGDQNITGIEFVVPADPAALCR